MTTESFTGGKRMDAREFAKFTRMDNKTGLSQDKLAEYLYEAAMRIMESSSESDQSDAAENNYAFVRLCKSSNIDWELLDDNTDRKYNPKAQKNRIKGLLKIDDQQFDKLVEIIPKVQISKTES